jgi:hypothetical protein
MNPVHNTLSYISVYFSPFTALYILTDIPILGCEIYSIRSHPSAVFFKDFIGNNNMAEGVTFEEGATMALLILES